MSTSYKTLYTEAKAEVHNLEEALLTLGDHRDQQEQANNNRHYTLGLNEGEYLTEYALSRLNVFQFIAWRHRWNKKLR